MKRYLLLLLFLSGCYESGYKPSYVISQEKLIEDAQHRQQAKALSLK